MKTDDLRKKWLCFSAESGNQYIYDDNSGMIYPKEASVVQKLLNTDYCGIQQNAESVSGEISVEEIKAYMNENGYNQLTLEMTADCNFRCKYCIYSEHYPETRALSKKNMSFETAKKAVDFYINAFMNKYRKNPNAFPTIGFYGGEPLLRFSTIRQIVEYIKKTYTFLTRIDYTITTNGFLLEDETADFLIANNFSVIVSLDGDKENHDRNRVTPDQKGTFDRVYKNICRMRSRHPDYQRFGLSVCYDYKTDLFQMRDFIKENDLFIVKFSQISGSNTDYYDQFTEEEETRFRRQLDVLRKEFFASVKNGTLASDLFLFPLIGTEYAEFSFHSMIREKRPSFLPYTAACVPGDKIYVTADGKLHICERVPHDMSIGSVDGGLDYNAIKELIQSYHQNVCCQCTDCSLTRLCGLCFSNARSNHGFQRAAGYCSAMKKLCGKKLTDLVSVLEYNPGLMEQVTVDYYQEVIRRAGYIIE